jgi:hypothetical protein
MMRHTQAESSSAPQQRRRAMQLVLDEVHSLQRGWESQGGMEEWASVGIINSSKVFGVTVRFRDWHCEVTLIARGHTLLFFK